jgi:hypothetical protein
VRALFEPLPHDRRAIEVAGDSLSQVTEQLHPAALPDRAAPVAVAAGIPAQPWLRFLSTSPPPGIPPRLTNESRPLQMPAVELQHRVRQRSNRLVILAACALAREAAGREAESPVRQAIPHTVTGRRPATTDRQRCSWLDVGGNSQALHPESAHQDHRKPPHPRSDCANLTVSAVETRPRLLWADGLVVGSNSTGHSHLPTCPRSSLRRSLSRASAQVFVTGESPIVRLPGFVCGSGGETDAVWRSWPS